MRSTATKLLNSPPLHAHSETPKGSWDHRKWQPVKWCPGSPSYTVAISRGSEYKDTTAFGRRTNESYSCCHHRWPTSRNLFLIPQLDAWSSKTQIKSIINSCSMKSIFCPVRLLFARVNRVASCSLNGLTLSGRGVTLDLNLIRFEVVDVAAHKLQRLSDRLGLDDKCRCSDTAVARIDEIFVTISKIRPQLKASCFSASSSDPEEGKTRFEQRTYTQKLTECERHVVIMMEPLTIRIQQSTPNETELFSCTWITIPFIL